MTLKLTLTAAQAKILNRFKISKYRGAAFSPFTAGEQISCRSDSIIESFSRHAPGTLTQMGAFSYVRESARDAALMHYGRYCSVSYGLRILDGHHPLEAVTTNPYIWGPHYSAANIHQDHVYRGKRDPFRRSYGPIQVGHDVWISAHCTIKAGITIGHGAVIAGGANVVKDVEPYAIVGGNPAKRIRYRFATKLRARLLALAWWDISPQILRDLDMHDPEDFCTRLERMQADGTLIHFAPAKLQVTETGQIQLIDEGSE